LKPPAFSPVDAALEGLRVMRREPMAVLYWIAVWALALTAVGVIKALMGAPARGTARDAGDLIRSFGPLAPVLIPILLALWVMNTATVYRAVLRPGEHGWHLFKLGSDEARIAAVNAVGTVLILIGGGAPAYLLLVLFEPILAAAPTLNWYIAVTGTVTTVFLEIWIAVRFSLAPVETFAEKGFPLETYWPLTRGHFWRLLGGYLIVVLEIALFLALFALVGLMFGLLADAALAWRGPALARRGLLLALVPAAALLGAVLLVAPSTLICACQAYAYRAIVAPRQAARAAA